MNNKILRDQVLDLLHKVGDLIKTTREAKGIKMADLAKRSGVSTSVISDLENHKGVMPNIYTLITIANALELPEGAFLQLMWGNITTQETVDSINRLDKLKQSLLEYGLPNECLDRVIDYIDYFTTLDNFENNFNLIRAIYSSEAKLGTDINKIVLPPSVLDEMRQNIIRIENIKARSFLK